MGPSRRAASLGDRVRNRRRDAARRHRRRHDGRLAPGSTLGRPHRRRLAGVVPFAFLGIALGYWAPARGALPIANLLYLVMSYVGGLWILPSRLPAGVEAISGFLPTRALSDGLAASARGAPVAWQSWGALGAFAVLFAGVAIAGYRRDEGRRFS